VDGAKRLNKKVQCDHEFNIHPSRRWLKDKLESRTNLEVDDPEELLGARIEAGVKGGLWLLFGVVDYNIKKLRLWHNG
jgi:hypothetical protein